MSRESGGAARGRFELIEHGDFLEIRAVGPLTVESARAATVEAAAFIRRPGQRWDILTDFSRASLQERGVNAVLGEYSKGNAGFVRKSAVIGLGGVKRFFFDLVVRLSGRYDLRPFADREEAIRWLREPLPGEPGA